MFGFIHKSKIEDVILKARKKEKAKSDRKYSEKLFQVQEDLQEDYLIKLADKNCEIAVLEKEIINLKDDVKKAQKAYKKYCQRVKDLDRISTNIEFQVKKLFGSSGEIYQSMLAIKDEAERYKCQMSLDDDENSKLLQLQTLSEKVG